MRESARVEVIGAEASSSSCPVAAVHFFLNHDERKDHHYYTPSPQANAAVYSSDDPCAHHGVGTVIMGRRRSSCSPRHAVRKKMNRTTAPIVLDKLKTAEI
jgi:hypothetical protein